MGLDVPELDDRDFEDLLADARRRIPVHSDDWTDHNLHDPGITILEVLAHVAESQLYRLDRETDSHRKAYLSLLGVRPRRQVSATADVRIDPPRSASNAIVEAGTPLRVEDAPGDVYRFETVDPLVRTRADVGAVVSRHGGGHTDYTAKNETAGIAFPAFGEQASAGSAVYVGFDADPFAYGPLDLRVGFHDEGIPEPASRDEVDRLAEESRFVADDERPFDPSVELTWEYLHDDEGWDLDAGWDELSVVRDRTNRLYGGGTIRFERPDDWPVEPAPILDRQRALYWIRCVLDESGYEVPPVIDAFRTNVVTAAHRATVEDEPLLGADGAPETTALSNQRFRFPNAPVLSATVTVGGERWTEVTDFDASGPDDKHYVLDPVAGEIRFGDEVQGTIPEPGKPVVAERYVYGGGEAGSVSSSASWEFVDSEPAGAGAGSELTDAGIETGRATGGRDGESIEEAFTRLERVLRTPYRGVTADDYAAIATRTPGLRFGRATAIVQTGDGTSDHEAGDGREGSDCAPRTTVRVVVVPFGTRPRPQPSDGFLETVERHVCRHRLLTDTVSVEPPNYVGVGVSAEMELTAGRSSTRRVEAVKRTLDKFLDPLDGYDGDGWPFGRSLHASELYETIEGISGVDCVYDLSVTTRGEAAVDGATVHIDETTLLYPLDHDIRIRSDRDRCGRHP